MDAPLGCLVQVVILVPPSKYSCPVCSLVAMQLRGVLVVLCLRFCGFTVAPKALPCVGYYYPPLHHFGTF